MSRLLNFLGHLATRFPKAVVAIFFILLAASVLGIVFHLDFKTDQTDLVGSDVAYHRHYQKYLEDFSDLEFIYAVIQVEGQPLRAIRAAHALNDEFLKLQKEGFIQSVLVRVPPEDLGYGLLFRDKKELKKLSKDLRENEPIFKHFSKINSYEKLYQFYSDLLDPRVYTNPAFISQGKSGQLFPWFFQFLNVSLASLENGLLGKAEIPLENQWALNMGLSLQDQGYLATSNNQFLTLEILPHKNTKTVELIAEPLRALRQSLERVRQQYPDVKMGLTGRPILQADEMMTTDKDMRKATILAFLGIALLFVIFFRRFKRPLLAMATLGVSVALTFGWVSLTIGYLNLLTIVFGAMLVGLGIDYGIHFIARYQEELARHGNTHAAIMNTLTTTGVGVGVGAMTTALAFFTALLVDFNALRQLGFIAGSGLIICFLSMVTLLPALLMLFDQTKELTQIKATPQIPFLKRLTQKPIFYLAIIFLVTLLGSYTLKGIPYDYNLLNLQAKGLESVDYETLLLEKSDKATWFAAFTTDSLNQAAVITEKLKNLDQIKTVGQVETIKDYIPEDQIGKKKQLSKALPVLNGITFQKPSRHVSIKTLKNTLKNLERKLNRFQLFIAKETVGFSPSSKEIAQMGLNIKEVLRLINQDTQGASSKVKANQTFFFSELKGLSERLKDAFSSGPFTPENLPQAIKRRFISKDGSRFLVYAYPLKNIWQEKEMNDFVAEMRSIDPHVNGTPFHFFESAWRMKAGFYKTTLYSFLIIFLFLLLDFRNLKNALLAMVPLFFSFLWLFESLNLLSLQFNLANFFALPILIGCGIDGGVHIVHRFKETGSIDSVIQSTCGAIFLSFLTTLVGFGSLIFASHQGVASLGKIMVLGLVCLMFSSVVVLPMMISLIKPALPKTTSGSFGGSEAPGRKSSNHQEVA